MLHQHKNIKIDFSEKTYISLTGDTELTIDGKMAARLIGDCCAFGEFFLEYQMEELYDELDRDIDKAEQHYEGLKDEEVIVSHADAIIAVYNYALEKENEEFRFKVESENISWVLHDILHATHDTAGCSIYVESEIERDRILTSLRQTKEQYPEQMPEYNFLENLESEFFDRFKKHLDLEEFKYYYEEE